MMQHELQILKAALITLHPGTYRYETPASIDSVFAVFDRREAKPMSQNRYFILTGQLLTHIHCGHTYTNYWNQPKVISNALFSKTCLPLLFRMIGRQMIITDNLSDSKKIKPGDELVAINGIPVKRIVDSLITVSQSDGLHGLPRKLDNISVEPLDADTSNYNLFDIYFPLFFPQNFDTDHYRLKLKAFNGGMYEDQVKSLSRTARLTTYNRRFGVLPVHEKDWSLKFLNEQTVCFTIGDFETWEWKADYHKYLDSIFTVLNQKKVQNLIVDIRGNGGGDDAARDEVFSYLTDKPFGCDDPMHRRIRFLVIPDTLLPYLKTWDKSFKEPKDPNRYKKLPGGWYENKADSLGACVPVQPKPNHFQGRLFLLTDGRNSSTTFTLAKMFRMAHAGEIIGETTGGNQQGINGGQFFFLYLPESKIEVDIPLIWGAYTGNKADTGLQPDIAVSITAASVSRNDDAVLDFVLNQIATGK
ncbi:S41 family peptidase [Mucilaginibacter flavus]|nr:S41 family peptidase [Mucilaginibacter flavus]